MTLHQDCFCELAPLYALGLLDESQQHWIEQQIQADHELAEELAQYQDTVAALAYGIDPAPTANNVPKIAPNLKRELFSRLDLSFPEQPQPHPPTPQASVPQGPSDEVSGAATDDGADQSSLKPSSSLWAVRSQNIRWRPHPTPGVLLATLHRDVNRREISGLLRAEAGVCYPFHIHTSVEEMYMVSGDLVIGDQVYGPGDYIRSEVGSAHAPSTRTGCMFFFRTSMDDQYPNN